MCLLFFAIIVHFWNACKSEQYCENGKCTLLKGEASDKPDVNIDDNKQFNFDQWITDHDLTGIKYLFIEYQATTKDKLTLKPLSTEITELMKDPRLLNT
eukprot:395870_1